MKPKRSTHRSFPGQMTQEEWLALPDLGRRDMIGRAACTLLECERFCTNRMCRRHRSCCGDDATECALRLWRLPRPRLKALQRDLCRLEDFARLPSPALPSPESPSPERADRQNTHKNVLWRIAGLGDPWNAPANPPWGPAAPSGASAVPGSGEAALDPAGGSVIRLRQPGNFSGEGG